MDDRQLPAQADHCAFADAIEVGNILKVVDLVQQHPSLVNHPDWTPPPIHCAVLWNQAEVVSCLLDHGADIESLDPDRQTTPLRYAILYCKTDVIPLLLTRGASASPVVENGTSALELAREAAAGEYESFDDLPAKHCYEKVVELLISMGV